MMSETDQAYERGKESAKRDLLDFVKAQEGQFFRTHDDYGANLVRKYLGLEPLTRIDLTQRAVDLYMEDVASALYRSEYEACLKRANIAEEIANEIDTIINPRSTA